MIAMPPFNLQDALERAARRFPEVSGARKARRSRADRGRSRLPEPVVALLDEALSGMDRPRFPDLQAAVSRLCEAQGIPRPSKATLYHYLAIAPLPSSMRRDLPPAVRNALHNLDDESRVPARQVVFAAFNYGNVEAISFASGLPWLALYQADRVRGWRPKSHALLRAVMKGRGI